MFLPGVEDNPKPGPRKDFIDRMKAENAEYPQLAHLFAFLPQATSHLSRFTQEIMRGESSIPAGMRELGYAMHQSASQFAVAAQDASVSGDLRPALAALAKINQNCVACHAAYKLK